MVPDMSYQPEKRGAERTPFPSAIRFDLIAWGARSLKNEEIEASGVDVSDSGVGLVSGRRLIRDEVLRLEFPFETAKATLPVLAVVVWAKPHGDRTRAGLRFLA